MSSQNELNVQPQPYVLYYNNVSNSDPTVYQADLSDVCTLIFDIDGNIAITAWLVGGYGPPSPTTLLTFPLATVLTFYNNFYAIPAAIGDIQPYHISTADLDLIRADNSMLGFTIYDTTAQAEKTWDGLAWLETPEIYLPLAGGTMTGNITMDSAGINGLTYTHFANNPLIIGPLAGLQEFADSGRLHTIAPGSLIEDIAYSSDLSAYLPLAGGTMSGDIDMGGSAINNANLPNYLETGGATSMQADLPMNGHELANTAAIRTSATNCIFGDGAAVLFNSNAIAIGTNATAGNNGSIAIGSGASTNSGFSNEIAIGVGATSGGADGVAIGSGSTTSTNGISIGNGSSSVNSISIGALTTAADGSTVVGSGSADVSSFSGNTVYGRSNTTDGINHLVLGESNVISGGSDRGIIGRDTTNAVDGTLLISSSFSMLGSDGVGTTDLGTSAKPFNNLYLNILKVSQGANTASGTGAVLVAGTTTVSTTAVATGDMVLLSCTALAAMAGTPCISSISNGASFTITSSNVLDTSTYSWLIVKPA